MGIARSREALADADLVLVVLDATQTLNEEESQLLRAVEGRAALIAVNKSDLDAQANGTENERTSHCGSHVGADG